MVKSKRKVRKGNLVYFILSLIIIVLLSYISYNNFSKLDKYKISKEEKNKYNSLNKEYKELEKSNKKIKDELNELKDLNKKIATVKDDVFSLASKVEKKIQNNESKAKIAYLTFDDGPYYMTDSVLKVLREKQVKATFFTIGIGKEKCFDKKSVSCMDTYKRIVDNGHTIANHTYSHSIFNGLYASVNNFMDQVVKQENLIKEKTGYTTNIIRFPGGSVTAGRLKDGIVDALREKGYGWVDWTAEDGDGRDLESKEQAWRLLKNDLNDNIEVILMHDYNDITYSILPDVIDYLENEGYILLPLFYDSVMVNKEV